MTVASATGSQWAQNVVASGTNTTNNATTTTSAQQTTAAPAQASPPYFSPATHVDPSTGIAVLVVLDDQGKILEQFPSQQVVDEYRRHQAPGQTPSTPSPTTTSVTSAKSADGTGSTDQSGQGHTDSTA